MRKKTSTIMAWLLAASVTVTSLSAGTVTAYAQEEMPLAEAGTVTESAEGFGDSSDSIADIAEEGNIEAKEKGELTALCCRLCTESLWQNQNLNRFRPIS